MKFKTENQVMIVRVSKRLSKKGNLCHFVRVVNPLTYDVAEFLVSKDIADQLEQLVEGELVYLTIETDGRYTKIDYSI